MNVLNQIPEARLGRGSALLEDDRRVATRLPARVCTRLVGADGTAALECTTDDISEAGMFFKAPVGYGLAVGQRYEVLFTDSQASQLLSDLVGESRYATVLRTEMRVNDSPQCVGVGMRFDQPLFL